LFSSLRLGGFSVEVDGLGLFGGDRPRAAYAAVAPCEPLMRLQRKVEGAARQVGIPVEGRKYLPHITLGRFRPPGLEDRARLERAVAEAAGFRAAPMPVQDFVLFESTLGRGGSRYDVLARYPLR
jgi:2'-5' RNA ligase